MHFDHLDSGDTDGSVEEGAILETLRAGMRDSDGGVLRKALVAVCGKKEPIEAPMELPDSAVSSDTDNLEDCDDSDEQGTTSEQYNYEDDE